VAGGTEAAEAAEAIVQVNALTRRWLERRGAEAGAVSGLGVWPLLAFLADAAEGPGRAELSGALGIPAGEAAAAARAVFGVVATIPAAAMASGLWTRSGLPLHREWLAKLPEAAHGELTGDADADRKRLDAWASEHTRGMIPEYPLDVDPLTVLAIAGALCVETEWAEKFATGRVGRWAGDRRRGGGLGLSRSSPRLTDAAVAATAIGPVTSVMVEGTGDVDVYLVLGPESAAPGEVLATGVDVIGHKVASVTADQVPLGTPGPGVTAREAEFARPGDVLTVHTVGFEIAADHDLKEYADLFGLSAVSESGRGHFPGMSPARLFVGEAKQSTVAEFGAEGFRATAVTTVHIGFGAGAPQTMYPVRWVDVWFDRPFAYYAVHRDSGLILVAGWVAEPQEYPASG
jgi:serine protease inhibitor